MATIKILKLVTNEDLICQIVDEDDLDFEVDKLDIEYFLFITKPSLLVKTFIKKDLTHSIELQDWVPEASDDIIILPKDKVVTMLTPTPEVEQLYIGSITVGPELDEETKKKLQLRNFLLKHRFDDEDMQ